MTEPTDLHALTGAYVLDALDDDERALFETHLEACDACAREVAELREPAARLSATTNVPPPPGLRERVLAEAARTPQERGSHPDELAARRALPRTAATPWGYRLTAAAAAVLLVAVAGLAYLVVDLNDRLAETEATAERARDTAETVSAVLAAPDATLVTSEAPGGAAARVVVSPSRGEAVLVAEGLAPAPGERTYQLWLIDEDGATSAGLFDTDADGRATEVLAGDLAGAAAIGVTLEPAGGSRQPTTEPVLAIELGG
jgi:anti-sigma-K factor RskA